MTLTTELNQKIIDILKEKGIICGFINDVVFINRTSMCHYPLTNGLDENECYQFVLLEIRENFDTNKYYIIYSVKDDENYYLDVYNR